MGNYEFRYVMTKLSMTITYRKKPNFFLHFLRYEPILVNFLRISWNETFSSSTWYNEFWLLITLSFRLLVVVIARVGTLRMVSPMVIHRTRSRWLSRIRCFFISSERWIRWCSRRWRCHELISSWSITKMCWIYAIILSTSWWWLTFASWLEKFWYFFS